LQLFILSFNSPEPWDHHATGRRCAPRYRHGGPQTHRTGNSPGKQIIEFAPWMIERARLELPDVRKVTRRVHEGRRFMSITHNDEQAQLFRDSGETLN
jgi:hypothetical protein